ncbi:MAG: hemY 1 [Hydrocarboniphaga sp.]|uniref:protoporphyrinogen/coproporphyrinogen oxidase n=1 Tax=Hydrocarboniphaga sp. TaxID=2033016 RepID=UPI0026112A77|nr:FAD-dependent oxidoreductase [Hydrocarboniphaga sp.]MDB5971510.1 hemY 1 [Hydrocarboniphaga sp.]
MTTNTRRAAVIGAGISGMTAAYRLQLAGFDVRVFEASDRAGGRVSTLRRNGYLMEQGADLFTHGYTRYLQLAEELGLTQQIVKIPSLMGTLRDGRIETMDSASPWSMATTRALSLSAKLRMISGMRKLKPLLAGMNPAFMHEHAHLDHEHSTAEAFGLRHFGAEVTDYVIDPLSRMLGGASAGYASPLNLLSELVLAGGGAMYSFRDGQSTLTDALAAKLDVRLRSRATAVVEDADGVQVSVEDSTGARSTERFDVAVIAVPYHQAIEIYGYLKQISAGLKAQLRFIKMIKIYLGYRARTHLGAYIVQVPRVEDAELMLIFLDHNKAPHRAPAGHSLLQLASDTQATEKMLDWPDAELEQWARARAEKLFPELSGSFEFSQVARWPRMSNYNGPGYFKHVAEIIEHLPASARVQIAGDLFTKTNQEGAMVWGERAAGNLAHHYGHRKN